MKKHSTPKATTKSLSKVVQIDEAKLQDHLGTVVRTTVEQIPLCVSGWNLVEAQLGRRSEEYCRFGGHWCGHGRLSQHPGVCEGAKEDHESWLNFLKHLKSCGLKTPRLIISDKCLGLVEALGEVYPKAAWQRCAVHFYRNVFSVVPTDKIKEMAGMLKAIHAQEDKEAAQEKAKRVVAKLELMRLKKAAETIREGAEETLRYYDFPTEHWRSLRTNNPLERLLREIRRRVVL